MKVFRLFNLLCLGALSVLVDSCQPQPEPTAQTTSPPVAGARSSASTRLATKTSLVAGPYTLTFVGVTYAGGQSTWTYQVQRTGPAQANGLSHMIFGLGCATSANVVSATIDNKSFSNLVYSEGKGTGCSPTGNFVKFDNLASPLSDGNVHTFTFTLNTTPGSQSGGIWVKAGKTCYPSTIVGPGCGNNIPDNLYDLSGRMEIRYCMGTIQTPGPDFGKIGSYGIHVAGIPIQLVRADNVVIDNTVTDKNGNYTFTGVPAGTYTVVVDTNKYNTMATNCTGQAIIPIVHVDAMVGALTIPSADYDTHGLMVDFWLDTFMPGTCGPDIVDGSSWLRGEDPYKYCP